jgi:hypothetical protein
MNTSTSHDDLDLLDISNWNANEHQFKLFDGNSFVHSSDEISHFTANSNDNYYDMNDNDTVASHRSSNNNMQGGGFQMRKTSNPPTITTIYEPKFLEIFQTYRRYAAEYEPSIDLQSPASQHLMTLCLSNLLSFANWARDSATKAYICEVLSLSIPPLDLISFVLYRLFTRILTCDQRCATDSL